MLALVAQLKLRDGLAQREERLAAPEQRPAQSAVPVPALTSMPSGKIGEAWKIYNAEGCLGIPDIPKIWEPWCESAS